MLVYAINIVLSLSLVAGTLAWRTDNFSAFTYETERRMSVEKKPVRLSDWQLQNSDGEIVSLSELSQKPVLVDFIYTRCPTICRALGSRYQQLQRAINTSGNDHIALLSISIDPVYDTPAQLNLYQQRYKGQKKTWHLARPIDEQALKLLIAETGLRVIPDGMGGLMHSDAIHLIQNRMLSRINPWDSSDWERVIHANNGS